MENWLLRHLLTLALLTTGEALILETNHILVTEGSTTDVEIACRQGNVPVATAGVSRISSIRIIKQGPFGSKVTLVQTQADGGTQPAKEDDVIVTGEINQNGPSFLKVKWNVANQNTPGTYGCEIDGFDSDNNIVSLHAEPVVIREKFLTVDDVKDLIISITSKFEEKQRALEFEIAHLKTYINNELNAKGEQISDVKETLAAEISVINEKLNSKYTTKNEVSFQISELLNFTLHEIMSDRNHMSCQDICHDLNSTLIDLGNSTFENIDSVEKDIKSVDAQLNHIADYFTEQVERLHLKVELCCSSSYSTPEIPTHHSRPPPGVSTPPHQEISTPATVSPSPQINLNRWPCGKYTLVKPRLGCPTSDDGKVIFYTVPYILMSNIDKIDNLFKVNLRYGYRTTKLQLCYRSTDLSSSTRWAKGSYCIGKSFSPCPEDFSKGEMKQKIMSETIKNGEKQPIGTYKQVFCCRSDGHTNVPLTLPTKDPFFMYRYKGKCQQVEGMDVQEESIYTWKGADVSTHLTTKWTTPDVDSGGNVILCHYLSRS